MRRVESVPGLLRIGKSQITSGRRGGHLVGRREEVIDGGVGMWDETLVILHSFLGGETTCRFRHTSRFVGEGRTHADRSMD